MLLAVSGGADSTALLCLASQAREILPDIAFSVATVDHGLRPEAAAEAQWVAALSARHGLEHRTLRWRPPQIRGNLAAAARDARYRLLAQEAARLGAAAILTAHHRDDQIETHLLAAARGGHGLLLAGMRPVRALRPGIALTRPFLNLPSERLRATLTAKGQGWLEDPTNRNPDYARVRARFALNEGLYDRAELLCAIGAAQTLRAEHDAQLSKVIADLTLRGALDVSEDGIVRIDADALALQADAIGAALMARAVTAASGSAVPPAARAVRALPIFRGASAATLSGARLVRDGSTLLIHREYGRTGQFSLEPMGEGSVWFDRRFIVRAVGPGRLAAFGATGRGNAISRTLPVLVGADGDIAAAHPALRRGSVPGLDVEETVGWRLTADLPGDPLGRHRAERTPKIQVPTSNLPELRPCLLASK